MPQIDIITGAPRYRTWTDDEKRSILAAAFAPGAIVKEVARRANISTGQLYTWRKRLMKKKPVGENGFARVVAIADQCPAVPSPLPSPASVPGSAPPTMPVCASDLPVIEIDVRGNKVRIPGSMPPALATAVLRVLVRRR